MNPLFTDDDERGQKDQGYVLPDHHRARRIEPGGAYANPAADLVRNKITALFAEEPNARAELQKAEAAGPSRSKHQEFMHRLNSSGKSLADIQRAWHAYYQNLSDHEKQEVWQEFYAAHAAKRTQQQPQSPAAAVTALHESASSALPPRHRSIASIKKQVLKKIREQNAVQLRAKQHLQSLAVGLGLGSAVLIIFLFGLFNEVIIAPFIRPSNNHVNATPIILSTDGLAPNATPEVIIPKINVQLPVIYGSQSVTEEDIQSSLNDGIFHYPTTAQPGQQGNAAYFGHSSNNILNKGKYKFAFVLLHELAPGDIFYLTNNKKVYTYRVYEKRVVEPTDTWVLNPVEGKPATAALITCDPPGTSLHRLVVWGEQISPDPSGNTAQAAPSAALQTVPLPGNGPSAWTKMVRLVNPFD